MERAYRLIYCLQFDLDPPPRCSSAHVIIWLGRDGKAANDRRNGTPRDPHKRTIDLREGDEMLLHGRWRKVLGVRAYRDNWLTAEEFAEDQGQLGYIYRPSDADRAKLSPCPRPSVEPPSFDSWRPLTSR